MTGNIQQDGWRHKTTKADIYFLKGVITAILKLLGVEPDSLEVFSHKKLSAALQIRINGSVMIQLGEVRHSLLNRFEIKQPLFYADINWNALQVQAEHREIII